MKKRYGKIIVAFALQLTAVTAQTTTLTASGNWVGGSWSNGEPGLDTDVVIAEGVNGSATNSVPVWSGTLTLEANARLTITAGTNPNPASMAFEGATAFFLADNSFIIDNFKTMTFSQPFTISGTAGLDSTANAGNNHGRTFTAPISGGTWVTDGRNHIAYIYQTANTFSAYEIRSTESQRHGVRFNAPGSAGLGDVTVTSGTGGPSAVIILGADDVFAPSAKLTLNARGWDGSTGGFGPVASGPWVGTTARIALQGFTATVAELWIDDVQLPSGTYTGGDGDWIVGAGSLIVQGSQSESFQLLISSSPTDPATLDFQWESQEGLVYDLLSSVDLSLPVDTWSPYDPDGEGGGEPYQNIASGGDGVTTLSEVPRDGKTRFFALKRKAAVPVAE